MACPTVHTGGRFLAEVLANVDCQAQSIGAYGFGALSAPGSAASLAITGLLTIFVALFAIRLILGEHMGARDVVLDVLKVGIVLTLATSWPAWRVLGYNTVLTAPAALAGVVHVRPCRLEARCGAGDTVGGGHRQALFHG